MTTSADESLDTMDPLTEVKTSSGHLKGLELFMTMAALTCVGFLLLLDVSVVTTAIPKITAHFHSLNDVGWYGSAYLLANCALQPLAGKIYGEFNMKWSFLAFFGIFELGSAVCGAATSSNMLIIGRAIAGMGGSGLLNGAYTIVYASMPLEKQPFLFGLLMGISQLGILAGPLIGGALTEYASWRWCFYINLPSGGLAVILLLYVSVPATQSTGTLRDRVLKLDILGFCFFAPAAIQLLLALQWGGVTYAWNSSTVIGLFCGAFATLLVFIGWEIHMKEKAMIPLSIVRRRIVWASCINYAFFVGSMLAATFYLPIYFQAVRNASPTMSGVDVLPSVIATAMFGIVGGALIGRIGYYLPFAALSGAIVMIGSGLASTFAPTTSIGVWIGYQVIMGAGRGMGFQPPLIAVQSNSPKEEVSIVNALVVLSQNLGGSVFLSFAQIIFSDGLRHYLAQYAPEVDPDIVIAAGAVNIAEVVTAAALPGVLLAYSKTFDRIMYLAVSCAGGAFVAAFGMGWTNIKKKAEEEKLRASVITLGTEKATRPELEKVEA